MNEENDLEAIIFMINSNLLDSMQNLGINISSIFIPNDKINMQKWSVVACDQYTSELDYWKDVDETVAESPSTLRLVFPEAYLEIETEEEKKDRIKSINDNMTSYCNDNILCQLSDSIILVERSFSSGHKRHGLMLSVDLEKYDYNKGSQSLIRATEGTIIDRLPPRIKIRENACLELPHIMLLIDDPKKSVIEPLLSKADSLAEVYSFNLMKDSGTIKGWKIHNENDIASIVNSLSKLADKDNFKSRYNLSEDMDVLLFAVGDGNHSLATAKACWENTKKGLDSTKLANHPARYALVEVVNVHDSGLVFEPIHRVLFNVDSHNLLNSFSAFYEKQDCKVKILSSDTDLSSFSGHAIKYITSDTEGYLLVECPLYNLDVGTLQSFLDEYLKNNKDTSIDYVHGQDVTKKLGSIPGNMGFFLDKLDKNELFKTVILDGALPRKTFSMGEASEKRFYLEARKIK